MKVKHRLAVIFCVIMALFLAACGSDPGPVADNDGNTAEETETVSSASMKVVVYMPSPAGLADNLAAGFEAATGIKVEQFQGTTGEILARLEAEQANPIADVVILASWADGLALKEEGKILSYSPQNADKLNWIDEDSTLFGTSASAVGVIYNTTLIDTLNADWNELASSEYKDMLAIPDPEKSGSCKDFLSGFINANGENSWSTWQALVDNGMTVPGANKAALEAVTTGEKAILVAGVDYNAYSSMEKGEPLDIYYPAGGTVINARPAMILKTSPHTDYAKAFVDYLLSDEAQEMVARAYLLPGREDVKCSSRANAEDIPQLDADWQWMMENSEEIARTLLEMWE